MKQEPGAAAAAGDTDAPQAAGTAATAAEDKAAVEGLLHDLTGAAQQGEQQAVQANVSQQEGELAAGRLCWVACGPQPIGRGRGAACAACAHPLRPLCIPMLPHPGCRPLPARPRAGPVRPFASVDVCPWDQAELPEWQEALGRACSQWRQDAAEALEQVGAAGRAVQLWAAGTGAGAFPSVLVRRIAFLTEVRPPDVTLPCLAFASVGAGRRQGGAAGRSGRGGRAVPVGRWVFWRAFFETAPPQGAGSMHCCSCCPLGNAAWRLVLSSSALQPSCSCLCGLRRRGGRGGGAGGARAPGRRLHGPPGLCPEGQAGHG